MSVSFPRLRKFSALMYSNMSSSSSSLLSFWDPYRLDVVSEVSKSVIIFFLAQLQGFLHLCLPVHSVSSNLLFFLVYFFLISVIVFFISGACLYFSLC